MGNTLISYPDRTLAALLSGGSWQAGAGLANLQNPLLAAVARSTNAQAASSIIQVDLGAALPIRVISLCGHNLTAGAVIRARGYSDSGYTTLVAGADSTGTASGSDIATNGTFASDTGWIKGSGWTISGGKANCNIGSQQNINQGTAISFKNKTWSITYTISSYVSGSCFASPGGYDSGPVRNANGTYTDIISAVNASAGSSFFFSSGASGFVGSVDNISIREYGFSSAWPSGFTTKNVADYPKNWTYCFSSPKAARYWKIEIVDTANPAGYIELGRCWLGESAFAPALGISYGLSLGYESKDIISESLGGIPWGEKRTPRRSLVATFNTLTAAEKRQAIIMQKVLTETTEAFFVTDTGAAAEDMLLEAFPCFLSKPSPIQYPYYNNNVLPIQVVERV